MISGLLYLHQKTDNLDRIHVELGFEVINNKMSAIVLILGERYGYILFVGVRRFVFLSTYSMCCHKASIKTFKKLLQTR